MIKKSFNLESKKNFLCIDYKKFILQHKLHCIDFEEFSNIDFSYLIYYAPNKEYDPFSNDQNFDFLSEFGFNSRNSNERMSKFFKELDLKNANYFSCFEPKKNNKENLDDEFASQNGCCLFCYNDAGIVKSFFGNLRNSICHCNIFKQKGSKYFYFLSVNKDGFLKFYLKIYDLKKITNAIKMLKYFKRSEL